MHAWALKSEPDGAGRDEVALGLHVALLLRLGVAAVLQNEALLCVNVPAERHLHGRCVLALGDDQVVHV